MATGETLSKGPRYGLKFIGLMKRYFLTCSLLIWAIAFVLYNVAVITVIFYRRFFLLITINKTNHGCNNVVVDFTKVTRSASLFLSLEIPIHYAHALVFSICINYQGLFKFNQLSKDYIKFELII
jgi:hypothetical protein